MDHRLKEIAASYDRAIDEGRRGIDSYSYDNLPEDLRNDPDYPAFAAAREQEQDSDSGRGEVHSFLAPAAGMHFVDLGCCVNLMFKGYDSWPSLYHGVDISAETIGVLRSYAEKNHVDVGALACCSMHDTPFDDAFFDIGACIGSLEYFERDFVAESLREAHRIMKPGGRFVLDIPDNGGKMRRFMNLIETSLGRPDRFDMMPEEFERLLDGLFTIIQIQDVPAVAMRMYFLVRI